MLETLILIIFVLSVSGIIHYARDVSHPYFWTNLFFLLYGISLVYLLIKGSDGARFLEMAGFSADFNDYLLATATIICIAKLAIELMGRGFAHTAFVPSRHYKITSSDLFLLRLLALLSFFAGFAYWIYVIKVTTGGSYNILSNIGVFKHVIKDSGLSTIYFQFTYIGAQLWFLTYFIKDRGHNIWKYALYIPAIAMMLSTGRLSETLAMLLTPFFFTMFNNTGQVPMHRSKKLMGIGSIAILFLFFYRQYTSYSYIGKVDDFLALIDIKNIGDYFFASVIGTGNLPDPQQIMLILDGISTGRLSLTYGLTYFDWVHNLVSSDQVQSVGYRILNAYFPDKVGGPTPGATGEALLNFGPFYWLFLMLAGYGFVLFQRKAKRSPSILLRFVYIKSLLHFWALYIKVDSSLLLGLMWQVVPISIVWLIIVQRSGSYDRTETNHDGHVTDRTSPNQTRFNTI